MIRGMSVGHQGFGETGHESISFSLLLRKRHKQELSLSVYSLSTYWLKDDDDIFSKENSL